MLSVVELTAVTVRVTLVMVRALKVRVSGEPSLGRVPVCTLLPSLKVRVAAGDLVVVVGAVVEDDLVDHHGGRPGERKPGADPLTDGGPLGGVVVGLAADDAVDRLAGELAGGGVLRGGRRRGLGGDVGVGAARAGLHGDRHAGRAAGELAVVDRQLEGESGGAAGAMKVGLTAVELERVTVGPAVCVQV